MGTSLVSGIGASITPTPKVKFNAGPVVTDPNSINALTNVTDYFNAAKGYAMPTCQVTPTPNLTPDKAKFNLPPHLWSRPITPQTVMSGGGSGFTPPGKNWTTDTGYRLTRMWGYQTNSSVGLTSTDPATPADPYAGGLTLSNPNLHWVGGARGGTLVPNSPSPTTSANNAATSYDYDWGFQFLWNPTSIQTGQQLNSNVTPSPADAYAGLAGLFNAIESVSFTIVLDRVNDFACAAGLKILNQQGTSSTTGSYIGFTPNNLSKSALKDLTQYYKDGAVSIARPDNPELFTDQIQNLLKLGTMADLEYFYRMINGSGAVAGGGLSATYWTNALGKKTADVAFLRPTPVAIQFGPSIHNLSYVGYINSLSVNHTIFTQDMVPLHTEVTVSMTGFSKTTLVSGGI